MIKFQTIFENPLVHVQADEMKVVDCTTDNLGEAGVGILSYLTRAIHNEHKPDNRIVAHFAYNRTVGELYLFLADNKPLKLKPPRTVEKYGHIAIFVAKSSMAMIEYFYSCKKCDKENAKAYADLIDYLRTQFYKNKIEIK